MKTTLDAILKGTAMLEPISGLVKKLEQKRPLKIKLGADPTAPDLHLGHAVVLGKMKLLQEMGHEIVFLIGDFTSKIGDPTGKSKTRPPLTDEQIQANSKTYFSQVGKILDINKTTIVFNRHWLEKLNLGDTIKMMAKCSLSQIIEREDFKNRMANNVSIGFHELLYPVLQAYDSVHLKADIELGGTDQTFNLLFGRHLQEQFGQEPQVVLTMPILVGLDGEQKMSKSLNNYVGLFEAPDQAFAKLMSLPDSAVAQYWELLLGLTKPEILECLAKIEAQTLHPMDWKKQMAKAVVSKFWSEPEAQSAQDAFVLRVQNKEFSQVPEMFVKVDQESIWIVDLLKLVGVATTSSEVKRLIESKSISIDGQTISDFKHLVTIKKDLILVVGKKFAKKLVF